MRANLAIVPDPPPATALLIERPNLMWEFRGTTFEEHLGCWQEIASEVERDSWMLGAIAASLVTKYNDATIDRFAHEVRLSARRVREIAQTYRAFQNGERSPILSFHHHTVAARGIEKGVDPVDAIHRAEDKEWSTRELETFVKTGIEPEPKAPRGARPRDDSYLDPHYKAFLLDYMVSQQSFLNRCTYDPFKREIERTIKRAKQQHGRTKDGDSLLVKKHVDEGCCTPEEVEEEVPLSRSEIKTFFIEFVGSKPRLKKKGLSYYSERPPIGNYEWRPIGQKTIVARGGRSFGCFRKDAPSGDDFKMPRSSRSYGIEDDEGDE